MKKYGFASAGMIYTLLVLFLILTVTMLNSMQNKKTILDNLKVETVESLYCNQNTLNELKEKVEELTKEVSYLKSLGNANSNEILTGKTALVKGNLITGTMTNYGREPNTNSLTTYNNHLYLYVPNYKTGINGSVGEEVGLIQRGIHTSLSNLGTASTNQVLSGATFTSTAGLKVKGTMANKGGSTVTSTTATESGSNVLISIPTNGYYTTSSKISVPIETLLNLKSVSDSAKKTGVQETLSKIKSIKLSYTAPSNGFVYVDMTMTVTNHDNSAGGSMWLYLYKNGSRIATASTGVSGWGGGTIYLQKTIQVNAGDTISYSQGYKLEYDFYLGTTVIHSALYAPIE